MYVYIRIYVYRILVHSTYEQYGALKNRDNSRISKGNRYPRMLYREHVVVGTVRVPLARSIAAEVSLVRRWRTSSRFIKPRPLSDFASCRPPRYYSPARSLWFFPSPLPFPLSTDISLPCGRLLNQSEVVPFDPIFRQSYAVIFIQVKLDYFKIVRWRILEFFQAISLIGRN